MYDKPTEKTPFNLPALDQLREQINQLEIEKSYLQRQVDEMSWVIESITKQIEDTSSSISTRPITGTGSPGSRY